MRFEITARPVFTFTLTREQIVMLMELSGMHYDNVCKAASQPRGFLYGWSTGATLMPANEAITVSASWRDLDIACKIMEMPVEPWQSAARELSQAFRNITTQARHTVCSWKLMYDTETKVFHSKGEHG
jgi:hypothetical protein